MHRQTIAIVIASYKYMQLHVRYKKINKTHTCLKYLLLINKYVHAFWVYVLECPHVQSVRW